MNKSYFFQEIIVKNPVLVGTIGICPIVAICTSLKAAVIMAVITIITLIVAQALSSLVFKHLTQWLRMGLYMLVGMAVVIPSIIVLDAISAEIMLAMGIYLPLLAVNPIIVRQCEREGVNIGLKDSIINSLCAGIGYSIVLLIVGFVREFVGNGSLWGFTIPFVQPIPSLLTPMGGFIIIGFLTAILHAYFKKIDPEYAEELAVNSRTAIKKGRNVKALLIDVDETTVVEEQPKPKRKRKAKVEEPVAEESPVALEEEIVVEDTPVLSDVEVTEEDPVALEPTPAAEPVLDTEEAVASEEVPQIAEPAKEEVVPQFAEPIKPAGGVTFADLTKAADASKSAEPVEAEPVPKSVEPAEVVKAPAEPAKAEKPAKAPRGTKQPKSDATTKEKTKAKPEQKADAAPKKKSQKFEFITLELPSAAKKAEAEVIPSGPVATEEATVKKHETSNRNIMPKEKAAKKAIDSETKKSSAKAKSGAKTETPADQKVAEKAPPKSRAKAAEKAPAKAGKSAEKAPAKTPSKTTKSNSKKTGSSIVYKSDELEKLMSMSLDDILNDLPDSSVKEEGESK